MPGADGTGPLGTGGRCMSYRMDGQCAKPAGHGLGFGRGFGRGMGRRFGCMPFTQAPAPISREEELQLLTEESSFHEIRMNEIKKRLEELNKK